MQHIIDHIPLSRTHRPGIKITPISLTIHNTGNPKSTDTNEHDWLTNPHNDRYASAHVFIDENSVTECIPLDEMAYHSGSQKGNLTSLSLEICEVGNYHQTLENAKEWIIDLLKSRGWTTLQLKRHFDWSGKICPRLFAENNWKKWDEFVNEINEML